MAVKVWAWRPEANNGFDGKYQDKWEAYVTTLQFTYANYDMIQFNWSFENFAKLAKKLQKNELWKPYVLPANGILCCIHNFAVWVQHRSFILKLSNIT